MNQKGAYEFGYMARKERIKLELLKTLCLVSMAYCLWALVFSDARTSFQLSRASGAVASAAFYLNFLRVRSEVMELFEPPYDIKGHGLAVLCFFFTMASMIYGFNGD